MLLPSTAARCQTAPATEGRLLFELKGQITPFGEIEYVTQRGVKNAFAICCHCLTVDESVTVSYTHLTLPTSSYV